MGDLTTWLQNLFSGNSTTGQSVPTAPSTSQIQVGASPNQYNTPTITDSLGSMSGLQLGQLGLGTLGGLFNGYLGYQNTQTAKNQAAQAQSNWNKQWDANVKTTNASLSDRQAARVASNPTAYESVDSYMKKYGIS